MKQVIDLTGQRFGRLVVTDIAPKQGRRIAWNCKCDCGNEKVIIADSLRGGKTNSCGCLQKEIVAARSFKHGHAKRGFLSTEHSSWTNMLSRCMNADHPRYGDYGGRGIAVCERWLDFENFFADMGPKPSSRHSIERINVNGNYDPDNCKWATDSEQAINQRIRSDNTTGTKGVYLIRGKWQASIGVNGELIYLGFYNSKDEAIEARKNAEKKYRESS